MLLVVTAAFLLLYALLIFYYFYHWLHSEDFTISGQVSQFISVVIAARNEEKNIGNLLRALANQSYPLNLFEVIVVDDFSTDATAKVIHEFSGLQLTRIQPAVAASHSSKKKAIETGIHHAKGEWIVITDADCIPQKKWLQTIALFQQKTNAVFIVAPVAFTTRFTLLSIFQSLDFITLQGITAASVQANVHSMCNGANLSYKRQCFFDVDGFKGIDQRASGDDMLLLYKIWKKYPQGVHYLKSKAAIVKTEAMKSWSQFIQQRVRWSSKATYYQDVRVTLVLLFVYLFNCFFFILLAFALSDPFYWRVLLYYLFGKIIIEMPFVYSVARFYQQQKWMVFFPLLQPLHILYTVLIGLISQVGKYEWKGRKTK